MADAIDTAAYPDGLVKTVDQLIDHAKSTGEYVSGNEAIMEQLKAHNLCWQGQVQPHYVK